MTETRLNEEQIQHAKEELHEQIEQYKKIPQMLEEEAQQIEDYISNPDLITQLIQEVQISVSGEEDTIIAIILIATTRLVKNAIPESTNLLLSDTTGLGKDHVTKKTLEVIVPDVEHLHVTKMTSEAFTYWHFKDEEWSWNQKVIHFEDITQQLLNCSTFKVMASGDNFAVVVKDQKTIEIPINGKPCMILTSHHANPQDEALRRFRIGSLDDTEGQTERIKNKISTSYSGRKKPKENVLLRSAIQSLESYPVIIPYAELLQFFFPNNSIMRTQYRCFLDYIAGSTILHQYQREETKDGALIATPDDYMVARIVLIYTTSNPKMIPLSREYCDILNLLKEKNVPMTIKDIEVCCNKSQRWLYTHLPRIAATELVIKDKKDFEWINKPVTTYQYDASQNGKSIPTWHEIVDKINKTDNSGSVLSEDKTLKKWLRNNHAKRNKTNCLVLHGFEIPLNRENLPVFTVLQGFLRDRDRDRYQKYIKDIEIDNPKSITLYNEDVSSQELIDHLLNDTEFFVEEVTEVLSLKTRAKTWGRFEICDTLAERYNKDYFDIKTLNLIRDKLRWINVDWYDAPFYQVDQWGTQYRLKPINKPFVTPEFELIETDENQVEKESETTTIDFQPYVPVGAIDKDGFDENHVCSI